ncbi:hypothetical protein AB0F07_29720 [Streptomyces fructofermentans]|uniref:hypothetical protein n=1 Tax=Streptomyces fructofermentans TaxID=152141 RepID=UPI0034014441
MSDVNSTATELASQYIAQVTGDLERNTTEQARVTADLEALQEQLLTLRRDQAVLVTMREALGGSLPADSPGPAAVPAQATSKSPKARPKKVSATSKRPASVAATTSTTAPEAQAAPEAPAKEDDSATESSSGTRPTLVELVRNHLGPANEPRSAAEITAALTDAHPDRTIKTTVVRTTLEGLVAKSRAQRTKQGSSVFYTSVAPTA